MQFIAFRLFLIKKHTKAGIFQVTLTFNTSHGDGLTHKNHPI